MAYHAGFYLDGAGVRICLTVRLNLTKGYVMSEAVNDFAGLAAAGASAVPAKTLYCSFCFKSQHHVGTLVSGPAGVFICDECVGLCNRVIAGGTIETPSSPSDKEIPTERMLERLQAIEETLQGKGNQLQWVVEVLRSRGVSWAQIGAGLGVSRQSAWERFT